MTAVCIDIQGFFQEIVFQVMSSNRELLLGHHSISDTLVHS